MTTSLSVYNMLPSVMAARVKCDLVPVRDNIRANAANGYMEPGQDPNPFVRITVFADGSIKLEENLE